MLIANLLDGTSQKDNSLVSVAFQLSKESLIENNSFLIRAQNVISEHYQCFYKQYLNL